MVQPVEVAWSVVSFVGLGFSIFVYVNAVRDLRFLLREGLNGLRRIMAYQDRRSEGVRMVAQACFLTAAIASMFRPPPPPGEGGLHRNIIIGLFVAVAVLKAYASVRAWMDRRAIRRAKEAVG